MTGFCFEKNIFMPPFFSETVSLYRVRGKKPFEKNERKGMKTMKTMKKIVCIGMCAAMLTGAALAEGTVNTGTQPAATGQNQQFNQQSRQLPAMPSGQQNGNQQQGQPPAKPSGEQNGEQQNSQPPQMPGMNGQDQQDQQGQPPAKPSGEQIGDQQNGQPLQMPGMNGQNQQDQQGQPPAMLSGEQNGDQQNGQPPELPENGNEAENAGTAVVQTGNKDPLRMRQKPSIKGRIMDQLSNGTEVEIIEVQEEWVKIRVNGKEGYVMIQYLDDVTQEQQEDADE